MRKSLRIYANYLNIYTENAFGLRPDKPTCSTQTDTKCIKMS